MNRAASHLVGRGAPKGSRKGEAFKGKTRRPETKKIISGLGHPPVSGTEGVYVANYASLEGGRDYLFGADQNISHRPGLYSWGKL